MTRYKLRYGKSNKYSTIISLLLLSAVITCFFIISSGTYLPGWATVVGVSLILLVFLSAPRLVIVSQNFLEIHCVLEIVRVDLMQIEKVEIVPRAKFKFIVPLLGMWGFFGYFGRYIDLRKWKIVRVYSQELRNLIRVEYDGGRVIYFGVREYEKLVREVKEKVNL